uniref:LSM domain protein n=1 Tax=Spironucleus salmonicida TaxID=348837 RepID=V6LBE6_9EUKA|eukprot:EST41727.1 LSM domain protein [Spironucleus salmonicida]
MNNVSSVKENNMPIMAVYQYHLKQSFVRVELCMFDHYYEGILLGFDEFFNITLGQCKRVHGQEILNYSQMLIKGESIAYIAELANE